MYWKKRLFPFMNRLETNNAIFQQDNAAIHTSKLTKDSFKIKHWSFDRPNKSPDLNPIGFFKGIFSRMICKNKRQIEYRGTLKSCIKQYWNEIPLKLSKNLLNQSKTGVFVVFWPFDPTKNAIPRWCTGKRWHILMAVMRGNRLGGNWLMKWDELKIPMEHS